MARGNTQDIIVVTGTPGTGKTTLAKTLARATDAKYVSITQYVADRKLYRALDRQRRTKIVDQAKTRRTLKRALADMRAPVVVDSHLSEGIVPAQMVRLAIVLRCHPRILEARLRAKKWASRKIRENVLAEILDSCLTAAVAYYGARKVIQIDTSHKNLRHCVDLARKALSGKRSSRGVKIDWLARLEKEHVLDRYLR